MTHLDDEDTPTSPGASPRYPSTVERRSPEEALQTTLRDVRLLHIAAACAVPPLLGCALRMLYLSGVL